MKLPISKDPASKSSYDLILVVVDYLMALSQHTVANEKDVELDLWSKSLYTGGELLSSF